MPYTASSFHYSSALWLSASVSFCSFCSFCPFYFVSFVVNSFSLRLRLVPLRSPSHFCPNFEISPLLFDRYLRKSLLFEDVSSLFEPGLNVVWIVSKVPERAMLTVLANLAESLIQKHTIAKWSAQCQLGAKCCVSNSLFFQSVTWYFRQAARIEKLALFLAFVPTLRFNGGATGEEEGKE